MLFRNTSAFFLAAVCTSFSLLTCPVGGVPCPNNTVAFVMPGCPDGEGMVDRNVFRADIEEVYGYHDCIELSPDSPSQSDLEDYDIIIVEGSRDFEDVAKPWLSMTGNEALVNLAKAGKKVYFNAADIYESADFPNGVSVNPFAQIFDAVISAGPLEPALNDPYDEHFYYRFSPLLNLPTDAITLMSMDGLCGDLWGDIPREPCSGTELAELPSSGGLLLGTLQFGFPYRGVRATARSNLRKSIYTEYMCAPVSADPVSADPVSADPVSADFCGTSSMTVKGEIVMKCCDEATNAVGEACCGVNPYDSVKQVCCSDDAVVNAGTDCDCA